MFPSPPTWTENAIIYHIYPMGFFDCPKVNPIARVNPKLAEIQPVNRLSKIRHYYDYFTKLGINTIYLGPIFESCTHGYDTIDYFTIDRRLGTNQLFFEIVSELHTLGFKVIIDGVFNHTSRLHPVFVDIKNNQQNSRFIDWYKNIDFSCNTVWQDGFSYKNWENHTELPELNLENTEVQKFIFKIIQFWQTKFNIDGWRLDVAYNLPPKIIEKIKQSTKQFNNQSFIFGELIHENYSNYVKPSLLDSCTNYQLYNTIIDSINQSDPWILDAEIDRQSKNYQNLRLINFTGNHDTTRLYTIMQREKDIAKFLELIMTFDGIPCIYYGDEIGLDGIKKSKLDNEIRQSMPLPHKFNFYQKKSFDTFRQIIFRYKK